MAFDMAEVSHLRWGVKHSLTHYLLGLPDLHVEVSGGAELSHNEPLILTWPVLSRSRSGARERIQFGGTIVFAGHGGMLVMEFSNPTILADADSGELAISARTVGAEPFTLGLLSRPAEVAAPAGRWQVTLAAPGRPLFDNIYEVGESLDDLELTATD